LGKKMKQRNSTEEKRRRITGVVLKAVLRRSGRKPQTKPGEIEDRQFI
jgi:hypothetical protein